MQESDSELPEPHIVLPTTSTTTPSVLRSASLLPHEEVLKFYIGLRLLGKEKQQRYLAYLQQLQEQESLPEGEEKNEF